MEELQNGQESAQIQPQQEQQKSLTNSQKGAIVSQGYSIAPQNLSELMTFANMLATSDLVPKDYRNKPGNVMVAMQMGHEIGLQPMQAIQNIAVINGKPSVYGDLGKALLRSKGCDIEEADIEEIKKTGVAWCIISRHGQKSVKRTFSIDDAKTAKLLNKEGPWSTYPQRQMAWRAFWFAARDAAPDLLKGILGREEIDDYPDIKVEPQVSFEDMMPKRLSETKSASAEPTKKEKFEDATLTKEQSQEITNLLRDYSVDDNEFFNYLEGIGAKNGIIYQSQLPSVMTWLKAMKPAKN